VSELEPVYLLLGSDRPKITRALRRLRMRVGEESVEVHSARDTSGEDAVAACNALGLFGGGEAARLVLVEEVERWKAADAKAVAGYLEAPTPGTVLALVGELKADAPLAKAVAPKPALRGRRVLAYEVQKRRLPAWVADQFKLQGAEADDAACRALVELVGDDLEELAAEVDKLATWAAGEPVTARDVERLAAGRAETAVFALTDAWGRRDVGGVLQSCEALLDRSERPRRDEVPRLLGSLISHVGRVRASQALAAEGVRPRDAAGRLKVHPFVAEKAFAHAQRYSAEELRAAVVRLAQLDAAVKGASRLAGDLELERALVDITAEPRPDGVAPAAS
jgi:DNA polymerase III subunit delta